MKSDLWMFYRQMLRCRRFEESVKNLWQQGKILGEMHLGIGEEAIAVGVVTHLIEGDAMALDHRATSPLVVRGVDMLLLLRGFLGKKDGLCAGMGGHMHLYSPDHLAASSGIVGASGPAAVGFALAAQYLRPKNIALAFFGDGAVNQGMLLESFNLAVTWKLPVVFICKNNQWAITTRSKTVTGGNLIERAKAFGMPTFEANGIDIEDVWNVAGEGISLARNGNGPAFIMATCPRLEGHFLGDAIVRILRKPSREIGEMAGPLMSAIFGFDGASVTKRTSALAELISSIRAVAKSQRRRHNDPVELTRKKLKVDEDRLNKLENEIEKEIQQIVEIALSLD